MRSRAEDKTRAAHVSLQVTYGTRVEIAGDADKGFHRLGSEIVVLTSWRIASTYDGRGP